MAAHWSRWLAFGFGSGLAPKAPGTFGTLFAWGSYSLLSFLFDTPALLVMTVCSLILGIWICDQAVNALRVPDHPAIVWDEIAAFWLVLWFTHWWFDTDSLLMGLLAFGLFRLFDAAKPPPISWLDRHVKGGFGVMLDDVAAAAATIVVLLIGQWVGGRWFVG